MELGVCHLVFALLTMCVLTGHAAMDLPKFKQMVLLYPGYYLHGGRYRDRDVIAMIGGHTSSHLHNTAPLRMSWTLNRLGGQHAVGTLPVSLSKHGNDSFPGKDGQQYIYRNTAYGPFLAARYGNPLLARANGQRDTERTLMEPFRRKQGIVRLVSYRGTHAGGHVALWDCERFVQSRDWTTEAHIISAEFWEAPDSYCPPADRPTPSPHLVKVTISPALLASQLHQHRLPDMRRHHRRQRPLSDVMFPGLRHQRHRQGHRREARHHGKVDDR